LKLHVAVAVALVYAFIKHQTKSKTSRICFIHSQQQPHPSRALYTDAACNLCAQLVTQAGQDKTRQQSGGGGVEGRGKGEETEDV